MDKTHFDNLLKSVKEMRRHMAGKRVRGVRTSRVVVADVQAIRKSANISQALFAKLIGVNLRTLQNWEQGRTRPTGPALALLKIVASNPKSAIEALHE
jgi:putative transcriptional regulator